MKIKMLLAVAIVFGLMFMQTPAKAFGPFENRNISITSILPPQYLGSAVEVGSTTQNVSTYYKISAVIPGFGETQASGVATAYSTYSPLSSTNSLRIMWSPVDNASAYKLYKSVDNTTFYFLNQISFPLLTFVDDGTLSLSTAYSAPSPMTGNLTVERSFIPGVMTLAQMNAYAPTGRGGTGSGEVFEISDATNCQLAISTGTGKGAFTIISSTSTHPQ